MRKTHTMRALSFVMALLLLLGGFAAFASFGAAEELPDELAPAEGQNYFFYEQAHNSEANTYRVICVANLAWLKSQETIEIYLTTETEAKLVPTSHLTVYRSVNAGDKVYTAAEGNVIFGWVVKNVPTALTHGYINKKPEKVTIKEFEKVTSQDEIDVSGENSDKYLIVYEQGATSKFFDFNGGDKAANAQDVSVLHNTIAYSDALYHVALGITFDEEADGFYLSTPNNTYLSGSSASSKGKNNPKMNVTSQKVLHEITVSDGAVHIVDKEHTDKDGAYVELRYNKNGTTVFRYYTPGTQEPVSLYKLVDKTVFSATYSVTFVDSEGKQVAAAQTVMDGGTASEPDAPQAEEGFHFDGWYKDPGFKEKFDFNTPITADTTVYANFAAGQGQKFVKVTKQEDIVDGGVYLIVCENKNLIMNGSVAESGKDINNITGYILNGELAFEEVLLKYALTWNATEGTLKNSQGNYFGHKDKENSSIVDPQKMTVSISVVGGNVTITDLDHTDDTFVLKVNGTYFRFYKSTNTSPVVQLYKLVTE